MKNLLDCGMVLTLLIGGFSSAHAQEPSLAPANLDYTESVIEKVHLVAQVQLETQKGQFTRYQYDRFPEVERIKTENGVFVRKKGSPWVRSDDWGVTGTPATDDQTQQLTWFVSVIGATFEQPNLTDTSQGGLVWRFLGKANDKTNTYYTYERSREFPKPGGIYPRYSFMKSATDTDGQLLLCQTVGQLRLGDNPIPLIIRFDYLFQDPHQKPGP